MNALSFRDLAEIDVGRLKGVGDKKRICARCDRRRQPARSGHLLPAALGRPIERGANRRSDAGRGGARARNGAFGDQARHPKPAHDGQRQRRGRLRPHGGGVLQPAVARAATARGLADRPVRQGRCLPRWSADGEPGRRPDRRSHGPDRADLSAEREGPDQHLGDRRLGRRGVAAMPRPWDRRSGAVRHPAASRDARPIRCAVEHPPPDSIRDKEQARRRLAFDELLRVQLVLVLRKRAMERDQRGIAHELSGDLVQRFHDALPYPLTGAQRRAIAEIERDLAAPHPMHRLAAGRRRLGQDRRGGRHDDGGGPGWSPGGADGADRGARRAARDRRPSAAGGGQRPRSGQPLR